MCERELNIPAWRNKSTLYRLSGFKDTITGEISLSNRPVLESDSEVENIAKENSGVVYESPNFKESSMR